MKETFASAVNLWINGVWWAVVNQLVEHLSNKGKSAASFSHQVLISPTFYEQLLRQNFFAKKLQTQIVST